MDFVSTNANEINHFANFKLGPKKMPWSWWNEALRNLEAFAPKHNNQKSEKGEFHTLNLHHFFLKQPRFTCHREASDKQPNVSASHHDSLAAVGALRLPGVLVLPCCPDAYEQDEDVEEGDGHKPLDMDGHGGTGLLLGTGGHGGDLHGGHTSHANTLTFVWLLSNPLQTLNFFPHLTKQRLSCSDEELNWD